jgi:hypothetical protein
MKTDPLQMLIIEGRGCKMYKDNNQYAIAESDAGLMPWQNKHDNLIDRFDVRAHMDVIGIFFVFHPSCPTVRGEKVKKATARKREEEEISS